MGYKESARRNVLKCSEEQLADIISGAIYDGELSDDVSVNNIDEWSDSDLNIVNEYLMENVHHHADYDEYYDESDYDSGMSYSQQVSCDRSDYAREMVELGKWCEEQAFEYRMGA
jgi:hypothetical protein